MGKSKKLPISEELDFHYLLGLMPALHNESGFEWLPELFSIVGHESLIYLCKYAGGEYIRIPTLEELSNSIDALQLFYDVDIKHDKALDEVISQNTHVLDLYHKIKGVYNAQND